LAGLIDHVSHHPKISLFTDTQLVGLTGNVGDFKATLEQQPRGVSPGFANLDAAIAACPVEVPDEFNYGLTRRKAIYTRHSGCTPGTAAIDWDHCTLCGACQRVEGGRDINLDRTTKRFDVSVGAIVVATGFSPYEPRPGEYGYGELPDVITLPQLIRLTASVEGRASLQWNGHPVRDIAIIHCVGSRQIEGLHQPQADGKVNPYCSRVCCTATMHAALELRRSFPAIRIYDIYQDIRTYGRGHEELYRQAGQAGTRFLRYLPEEGPSVAANTVGGDHTLVVTVKDTLTWGETIEVPVDLVVLAVGMMPGPIDELYELLKITPGSDRFLLEVHPKLRPVETAVNGIVLAGTAQGPMNIQESIASAGAAAAKVNGLLSAGKVELEPFVARVNPDRCKGDGACVEVCQYEGAIRLETQPINGDVIRFAVVTQANCVGCGVCVGACPNQAIDVQGWTLGQYRAMIDAIAARIPELEEVR
jgi:heterodisulfide reductase subunit A